MKTKFIALLLAVAGIALTGSIKAQTCPYKIVNNLNCNIVVTVDFYEWVGADCMQCHSVNVPVNANSSSAPINCGACGTLCDIVFYVISPFTSVDCNSTNPGVSGSAPLSCSPGATYNLTWTSSAGIINP